MVFRKRWVNVREKEVVGGCYKFYFLSFKEENLVIGDF